MIIKFYSLPGCVNCEHLKELFKRAKTEYEQIVLSQDMSIDDFQKIYPGINKLPHVIIDDQSVGGLIETVTYFVENKLVNTVRS